MTKETKENKDKGWVRMGCGGLVCLVFEAFPYPWGTAFSIFSHDSGKRIFSGLEMCGLVLTDAVKISAVCLILLQGTKFENLVLPVHTGLCGAGGSDRRKIY